jgi:hypothetical protein
MGLINLLTDLNSFYQNNPYAQQYNGGSQYATPPAAIAKGSFDQKSLKYGEDRQGGGSSNEPYITTSIPDGYVGTSPDFILRGGILNPEYVRNDVSRLTKFFADTKSARGLLFIAKQQLLERQNVVAPGAPNRIYNPAGTIAQAGVLGIGYHLNKQGLNPFARGYFNGGREGYYYFTKERNDIDESVIGGENRLVLLYNTKQIETPKPLDISTGRILYDISDNNQSLFSYSGGPNSVGGFGKTNIRITSDRTGLVSDTIKNNPKYIIGSPPNWIYNPSFGGKGVSIQYTADAELDEASVYELLYTSNPQNILNRDIGTGGILVTKDDPDNNVYTFDGQEIIDQEPKSKRKTTALNSITDYRKIINDNLGQQVLFSSNYRDFNRETNYSSSITNYTIQQRDPNNPNKSYNLDGINATKVLQGKPEDFIGLANSDLVKFFFEINNNNAQTNTKNWFLFFRAYLNDLTDNFQPEWQSYRYAGRGENFFKYSGFTRTMQLSFTVYAHSRAEMLPIYEKLNYLVGTTAPDYSDIGLMRGNFINLTVGDYLDSVPGIITNISLKPSFEAGWDLNRDEKGNIIKLGENLVGQLPRMIDINLGFTPIHSFTPQFKKKFIRNLPITREELLQALQPTFDDPTELQTPTE